jgi:polyhydroxybutyrate depolymerase
MRLLFIAIMFLIALATPATAKATAATELSFEVGGVARRAIMVNQAPEGEQRAVVLVLHGGRGSADEQRRRTGFDALAVAEGFTVVYAEGSEWGPGFHAWNTGYLQRRQVGGADDIGYFDTLINLLVSEHRADPKRVYMTGGSNGAMMTFVYAARRPEKLAAIAPVVGAMFSFAERPSVPLPILMINGAADNEVPVAGGLSRTPMVRNAQAAPYKSLDDTIAFWVSANRSDPAPAIDVQGTVTTRTFAATPNGAVTISVVDSVGGHGWPGTASRRPDNTPIQAFDGAEKVWAFFKSQRRP